MRKAQASGLCTGQSRRCVVYLMHSFETRIGGSIIFMSTTGRYAGLTVLFLGIIAVIPATAAHTPSIDGTYSMTGTRVCLLSQSGFNADFSPVDPSSGNAMIVQEVEGTITFNEDGTGFRSGTANISIISGTHSHPSVGTFAGAFNYTIDDGTVHFVTSEPTTGIFTHGPRAGSQYSVEDIELSGKVGKNFQTIHLGTKEIVVETVSYSNGDDVDRVCSRSRVLTRSDR